jgi:hypothetical protein
MIRFKAKFPSITVYIELYAFFPAFCKLSSKSFKNKKLTDSIFLGW